MNKLNQKTKDWIKIITIILIIGLVWLFIKLVFFGEKLNEYGASLDTMDQRKQQYTTQNPNATSEQVDAAFEKGLSDIEQRKAFYKIDNPWASDKDAERALDKAYNNLWS